MSSLRQRAQTTRICTQQVGAQGTFAAYRRQLCPGPRVKRGSSAQAQMARVVQRGTAPAHGEGGRQRERSVQEHDAKQPRRRRDSGASVLSAAALRGAFERLHQYGSCYGTGTWRTGRLRTHCRTISSSASRPGGRFVRAVPSLPLPFVRAILSRGEARSSQRVFPPRRPHAPHPSWSPRRVIRWGCQASGRSAEQLQGAAGNDEPPH